MVGPAYQIRFVYCLISGQTGTYTFHVSCICAHIRAIQQGNYETTHFAMLYLFVCSFIHACPYLYYCFFLLREIKAPVAARRNVDQMHKKSERKKYSFFLGRLEKQPFSDNKTSLHSIPEELKNFNAAFLLSFAPNSFLTFDVFTFPRHWAAAKEGNKRKKCVSTKKEQLSPTIELFQENNLNLK